MIDYTEDVKLYSEGYTLRQAAKICGVGYTKFQGYMSETGQSRGNRKHKNLIGEKFGQLSVVEDVLDDKRHWWYICECECGNRQRFRGHQLVRGLVVKCGDCRRFGKESALWKGHGEVSRTYWNAIRKGAATRNIPFEISIEYVWDLYKKQRGRCALSGVPIPMAKTRRDHVVASLDRKNSSRGYTSDNVQWVHKTINRMKLDAPMSEFVKWCSLVAESQQGASCVIESSR